MHVAARNMHVAAPQQQLHAAGCTLTAQGLLLMHSIKLFVHQVLRLLQGGCGLLLSMLCHLVWRLTMRSSKLCCESTSLRMPWVACTHQVTQTHIPG
jgi:hypothetical protein